MYHTKAKKSAQKIVANLTKLMYTVIPYMPY